MVREAIKGQLERGRYSPGTVEQLEAKVEELQKQLDVIRTQYHHFTLPGIEWLHFTVSERMLVKLLFDAGEKPVGRSHLYDALYALKPEADWAEDKIIDVFICKIRRKLIGSPWTIATEYGTGYALKKKVAP